MKQKIHGPHRSLNNCWEKQLIVIPRYCWNWPSGSESKNPHSTTLKRLLLFETQVSFSDRLSSVIRLSVNFSFFHILLQNHWANFNQSFLGVQMMGDNSEIAKIHGRNSKIFFPKTMGQFQLNLDTQCIFEWSGFKFVQMKNHSILIKFFFS